MPEQFLHGIEIVEIDNGARPISTVRSSVIGLIGTAPNSSAAVHAVLLTGIVGSHNAITWTAEAANAAGNNITVQLCDPKAASQSLSVSVNGAAIIVNLATDSEKAISSTAALVIAAITASDTASALLGAANTGASDGTGKVTASIKTKPLTGGLDEAFPLNTPVLVTGSRIGAMALDTIGTKDGTLPDAMDAIFDQAGAMVVVVRVAAGIDDDATISNIIGANATSGVQAFLRRPSRCLKWCVSGAGRE